LDAPDGRNRIGGSNPSLSKRIDFVEIFRSFESIPTGVCTENLNPEVMVMESAEDRARLYASGPLNRANNRCVFVQ
jgi:hypothetical protein